MPEKVTAMTESTALADNDLIMVIDDSTGTPDNVKVSLATLKAFVASTGGGGGSTAAWEVTSTGAGSTGVSEVDISLSTAFGGFHLEAYFEAATNNETLRMLVSPSSSTGFSTGGVYDWANDWRYTGGGVGNAGANSGSFIRHGNDGGSNVSNEGLWISIDLLAVNDSSVHTGFVGMATGYDDNNVMFQCRHGARHIVATTLTALRFQWGSGNVSKYRYRLTGKP